MAGRRWFTCENCDEEDYDECECTEDWACEVCAPALYERSEAYAKFCRECRK